MKIPRGLPQFQGREALVIVTGTQKTHFYSAENGNLRRVETLIGEKPHYSDREGFFATRGSGGRARSGSVLKSIHQITAHDYRLAFKRTVADLYKKHQVAEVWFFGAKRTYKELERALPPKMQEKVRYVEAGNYYKKTPLEIIKKIEEARLDFRVKYL